MGMKVASSSPSLQWIHHSPQTLASKRQIWFLSQRLNRSSLLGTQLHRSNSCELWQSSSSSSSSKPILRRVCSLDPFSDEEFSKKIQELTLRFKEDSMMEKSNGVFDDLPISLRIIKKKRELEEEEGVKESSMNKAFSSMVFMIRELQSFTLHMREILFYQDLQGILLRVREEMHQSFVWLFQRVFSATPTLMVYVMLLLANFTVYSIGSNSALATTTTITELTSESRDEANVNFDSSVVKTFFVSTNPGGGGGGGGNIKPVLSGTDGDGFDESEQLRTIIPQGGGGGGVSQLSISGQDEHRLWNSMVEEAETMQYSNIDDDDSLDQETRKRFVSHVEARVEGEEDIDYLKTELMYQTGLSQEPNNPLLLTNYAQFLYLVSNDHDRAEEYFKRAVGVEPKDAEALSKYATFLWRVRDDLWAAEETFLEAIDADPTNSYYAANYANFLWNTGGDETCFPLDDESHEDTI